MTTFRRHDHELRKAINGLTLKITSINNDQDLYAMSAQVVKQFLELEHLIIVKATHKQTKAKLKVVFHDNKGVCLEQSTTNALWIKNPVLSLSLLTKEPVELNENTTEELSRVIHTDLLAHNVWLFPIEHRHLNEKIICIFAGQPEHLTRKKVHRILALSNFIGFMYHRTHLLRNNLNFKNSKYSLHHNITGNHLFQHNPIPTFLVDLNGKILKMNKQANHKFSSLFKNSDVTHINTVIPENFPNEHRFRMLNTAVPDPSEVKKFSHNIQISFNERTMAQIECVPINIHEFIQSFYILITDIQKEVSHKNQKNELLLKTSHFSNNLSIGIIELDSNWEIVSKNNYWKNNFEYLDSRLGEKYRHWYELLGFQWNNTIFKKLREQVSNNLDFHCNLPLESSNHTARLVEIRVQPNFSTQGQFLGSTLIALDVTHHLLQRENLRAQAELDFLTGLDNRPTFLNKAKLAISQLSQNETLAVLCLDLDGFKKVNDTWGHQTGDELLIEISNRLKIAAAQSTSVCRLGGDEFAILVTALQKVENLSKLAENLLQILIEKPITTKKCKVFTTVSIGIATTSNAHESIDVLLNQADQALYEAKRLGKNNYQYFTSSNKRLAVQDNTSLIQVKNNFLEAINNNKIFTSYQAQACTDQQKISGVETYLGFNENISLLEHQNLFQILEDTGLIIPTGYKLIQKSIVDFSSWMKKNLLSTDSNLCINLSFKQFFDTNIIQTVKKLLDLHGLKPENICFEIEEEVVYNQPTKCMLQIEKFLDEEFQVSIDNVGSVQTRFEVLSQTKAPMIKLNRFRVHNLHSNHEKALIKSLLNYCNDLDIQTLANGVEQPEQLHWLADNRCNSYQGHIIHRPCRRANFEEILNKKSLIHKKQ